MRRTILLTLALCALFMISSHVSAAGKVSATVTIDNTAGGVALPASLIAPTGAGGGQQKYCLGRLETGEIRMWTSGSTPSTTVGVLLEPLEIMTITGYDSMAAWRGIRTTATSGTLNVECWR